MQKKNHLNFHNNQNCRYISKIKHKRSDMDLYKVQSLTALNYLKEIVKPNLEARPNKYYLVMEHEDKPYLSPSLGQVKISKTIHEQLKGKHQHWLIWWTGHHLFSSCSFYKYISKYSRQWDERRTNPTTYSNSGPLFINYKANYKFSTTIFQNANGRKILDWSCSHPDYRPKDPFTDKTNGFYRVATSSNI